MKLNFYTIVLMCFITACSDKQPIQTVEVPVRFVGKAYEAMTEIMVRDVTNPPLAARFFAYASLSGYEIIAQHDSTIPSMKGRINQFKGIDFPVINGYHYQAASLLAVIETARKLQPSGKLLAEFEKAMSDSLLRMGLSEDQLEKSKDYAVAVAGQVMEYAKSDGYNRISNFSRYTPVAEEGKWYPTPPAFIAAVEPYFHTVRTFFLDSSSQFQPLEPVRFSTDRNSDFFKMMLKNYTDTIGQREKEIAAFWDCNPFVVQDKGHLLVGIKKISPGAHWMGIASIACSEGKRNFNQGIEVCTYVSMGLMDGFICCWDEKYRSNRVRPETAIRKYIDPSWKPLLQTPPFPEYLSGHSVVSTVSAGILENYFGEGFRFTDTVEVSYGLSPRTFNSFQEAAEEAAISRYYGGIHFMDAIVEGQNQGQKLSRHIIGKLGLQSRFTNPQATAKKNN